MRGARCEVQAAWGVSGGLIARARLPCGPTPRQAMREIGLDKVQIATKYMPLKHGDSMTAATVLEACKASCERLGVECVDLYYVHRIHPSVSVEEQAQAMRAVVEAGLAKHVGLSEFSAANIRKFHAVCPVTCVQQEWSLMNRDLEASATCFTIATLCMLHCTALAQR